jgi:hypothetical protein
MNLKILLFKFSTLVQSYKDCNFREGLFYKLSMLSNTMQTCTFLLTSNSTLPRSLNKTFVPKCCKIFHKHLKPHPYFYIMDGVYYMVPLTTHPLVWEVDGTHWFEAPPSPAPGPVFFGQQQKKLVQPKKKLA